MDILGIESSCDESAAAVVRDGRKILSSAVSSQIELHQPYAGVVPELASRAHVLQLNQVVTEALGGKTSRPKVDAIAVTVGPGLVGALLVGRMTAEALGWGWNLPVYGVNHIEGHLLSPVLLENALKPPFLGLVVSGGHTELILAKDWGQYRLVGGTRDDAAGEAFDKVAKMLDLGYPGGPVIDRLAKEGREGKFKFPHPWLPGTWDFSFSGLKTAVLYLLRTKKKWSLTEKKDICRVFQSVVVDVLVAKTIASAVALKVKSVVVGGGVAANSELRHRLESAAQGAGLKLFIAPPSLCTDNAAMIASAAYFRLKTGRAKGKMDLRIFSQLHLSPLSRRLPKFVPA